MRRRSRTMAALGLGLCIGTPQLSLAQDAGNTGAPTCSGASDCNAGASKCTIRDETTSFWLSVRIADHASGVSSDGRGRYLRGTDGVRWGVVQSMAALGFDPSTDTAAHHRTLRVNLTQPVPGGGGVPLGIVVDGRDNGLYAALGRAGDTLLSLHDIPIGRTVPAPQLSVMFHLENRFHVLQIGPQALGHCHVTPTLVHGNGTSTGTIHRAGPAKWVVDLPDGSIGRLFDISRTVVHAVDRGLYRTRLRYEIGDDTTSTGTLAGRITKVGPNDPLPRAVVGLHLPDGTPIAATLARVDGSYETPHVPAGIYEVRIRARGFSPATAPAVTIGAKSMTIHDAVLKPAPPD